MSSLVEGAGVPRRSQNRSADPATARPLRELAAPRDPQLPGQPAPKTVGWHSYAMPLHSDLDPTPYPRAVLQVPLELLRCPATRQTLQDHGDRVVTADGKHSYPVVGGIPILISENLS